MRTVLLISLLMSISTGCQSYPATPYELAQCEDPECLEANTTPCPEGDCDVEDAASSEVEDDNLDTSTPFICDSEEGLELFERKISPLLTEDRPSSCNRCHLAGIDIKAFVRDSPCQAMSCLIESDLVDFEAPDESVILSWIERANPNYEQQDDTLVRQEYDGFLEWISYSAQCHDQVCTGDDNICPARDEPCTGDAINADCFQPEAPSSSQDPCLIDPFTPGCEPEELEPCSEAGLAQSFVINVFRWRGRCKHCHEPDSNINVGDPPKWLEGSDSRTDAWETIHNLLALDAIDVENPAESLLILKPLDEDAGGVEHIGGTKLRDDTDPAYDDFLRWLTQYAVCVRAEDGD